MEARQTMTRWVQKVVAERARLGSEQMDEVIRGMTEPGRADRSTIGAVVAALGHGE